jgi:hypothetical protein
MLILLEMLMQGKAQQELSSSWRVGVYRSSKYDMSDIMACSGASRSAGFCAEHTIAEGG